MPHLSTLPQAADVCIPADVKDQHGKDAFEVRFGTAARNAEATGSVPHTANGDEIRFPDKSGTYTKALKQAGYGLVDLDAFRKFRHATEHPESGNAFELPGMLGGGRPLNGPLGAFALTLSGADSRCFGDPLVPPAPSVASREYGTELVELYWASLLRDVPFTDYETNRTAIAAAQELTRMKRHYAGPLENGEVTPRLLFRGGFNDPDGTFFGQQFGPYTSQFAIVPTMLGALPIDQKFVILAAENDYLTDLDEWQAIQNGENPTGSAPMNPQRRHLYNGRALASYTNVDELYQAYFIAYLAMKTMGVPRNPTWPYNNQLRLKNQQAFGTFGGPDIAATLASVARAALNAVWYQKWVVHLRHRPESGGGLVHLQLTPGLPDPKPLAQVHPDVLNSTALELSRERNGSYLLSQAFREGSPTHPAYPTGHGTVAGACITALKFFFQGEAKLADLPFRAQVPARDGLSLEPYDGPDLGGMTVNGELHKLAYNISFGHGIHAGIHWRSDTDYSILLGEAVALSLLRDQAFTYEEKVDIRITRLDGSLETIQN